MRGYRAAYADLFAQLPTSTRLTILVHPKATGVLQELLTGADCVARTTVATAPADLRFTVWAQDAFLALEDSDGGTSLLAPFFFRRDGDEDVAAALGELTGIRIQPSSLCFQGGYVLVADDFVLVGRDCLDATLETFEEQGMTVPEGSHRGERAARIFRDELGDREVIFVGTDLAVLEPISRSITVNGVERLELLYDDAGLAQPLEHIDMFVALAGRGRNGAYRLLVGSPALADHLLNRPIPEHTLDPLFDDIASQLTAQGFDVIRNPLPLTYADGRRTIEGEEREVRIWYFASSNNCLVQIDEAEGNHVWLPTYGHGAWKELAVTDEANRVAWEELGFSVHQLTNFHAFAQRLGAVHCITKDLER